MTTRTAATADTWVDLWLDSLCDRYRHQKLSCLAQTTLSWAAALFCFIYYGALYVMAALSSSSFWTNTTGSIFRRRNHKNTNAPLLLPLVTHPQISTTTTTAISSQDLYTQLCQAVGGGTVSGDDDDCVFFSPTRLVKAIRTNLALRRLVSEFMMQQQQLLQLLQHQQSSLPQKEDASLSSLYHQLDAIWPDLLRLPDKDEETEASSSSSSSTTTTTTTTTTSSNNNDSAAVTKSSCGGASSYSFAVTLVMIAYREEGSSIARTLQQAIQACQDPWTVQVVLVDAGQNQGLSDALAGLGLSVSAHPTNSSSKSSSSSSIGGELLCGQFQLVPAHGHGSRGGGGRGPCLNLGAAHAQGRILTFLHADTLLPEHWDRQVIQTFGQNKSSSSNSSNSSEMIVQASAFGFGHDLRQGRPCGIGAVRWLGNWRASVIKLPYGDHVISIPTHYFHYLGGFPNQPIMEDYALMDLLRKRARVLPERLHIIDGPPVRCSVRRWEAFGVAYVTLVNALIVHRYTQCGWTANDVFDYYYKRPNRLKQTLKVKI